MIQEKHNMPAIKLHALLESEGLPTLQELEESFGKNAFTKLQQILKKSGKEKATLLICTYKIKPASLLTNSQRLSVLLNQLKLDDELYRSGVLPKFNPICYLITCFKYYLFL
jgi:hypothetical protein